MRRDRRLIASALALIAGVAVGLAPGRAQTRPSSRGFPDTSARIAIFADQLPTLTPAQRRFAATHFVGTQKLTRTLSEQLRALNPRFLVLHYRLGIWQSAPNVSYIVDGRTWGNDYNTVVQHEDWLWHNAQGNRVASRHDGKLLLNIGHADLRRYMADSLLAQVQAGDYDGVFADSSSPALLQADLGPDIEPRLAGTGAKDVPIPALGNRTFVAAWTSYMAGLDRALAARGITLIPNVGSLTTGWDPTPYEALPGAFVERFASRHIPIADWQLSTDRLLALAGAGKILILENYLRETSDVASRRYFLANYLLVRGARTYLDYFARSPLEWYPEWDLELGRALTDPRRSDDLLADGVYRRDFERGTVLVNPSTEARTVTLDAPKRRVELRGGGRVDEAGKARGSIATTTVTAIVVPAAGAEILLR
jgi:hypothetical protein